ncbi:Cullin-2 [Brachionus plicatilis]|uniref:Cullin-2 n=1 Tax=Brachionus plicatilis TaxID=10195 RepID=A0A3M7QZS7_BRAPC|nr:Cullin-2 [Brachionus plicatilis]
MSAMSARVFGLVSQDVRPYRPKCSTKIAIFFFENKSLIKFLMDGNIHLYQGISLMFSEGMKLNYLKKHYSVTMGTFQMAILLGFNHSAAISLKEIQETTQLQSLLESKLPAESTANKSLSEDLNESTVITLNLNYFNKRTKFKINAAIQNETPQETEMTQTSVDEDRKLYLQATIVRVMKSRKNLSHNLLIQEVINQSKGRFTPSISLIKKCIESLIDKQYIERTAKTKDEYSYIA